MNWVLLIVFSAHSAGYNTYPDAISTAQIEFQTKELCEKAKLNFYTKTRGYFTDPKASILECIQRKK